MATKKWKKGRDPQNIGTKGAFGGNGKGKEKRK